MDALTKFKQFQDMKNRLQEKPVVDFQDEQNVMADPQPASFDDIQNDEINNSEMETSNENAPVEDSTDDMIPNQIPVTSTMQVKPGTNYQDKFRNNLAQKQINDSREHADSQDYSDRLTNYAHIMRGLKYKDLADGIQKQSEDNMADYYKNHSDQRSQDENISSNIKNEIGIGDKGMDLTNKENLMDPNSKISKFMQIRALQKQRSLPLDQQMFTGADIQGLSAYDLMKMKSIDSQDLRAQALELQRQALDQRERFGRERLDLGGKAENRKGKQFENTVNEQEQVSDKQADDLTSYDMALAGLQDAYDLKKQVDTGFLKEKDDRVRKYFGNEDVNLSKLKMRIGKVLAATIKQASGTAASDTERAFLSEVNLPTINDSDKIFNSKLEEAIRALNQRKKINIGGILKQGKKGAANFEKGPELEKASAPIEESVTIKLPNGNIGKVKKSKAQKYLDQGGVIVQE